MQVVSKAKWVRDLLCAFVFCAVAPGALAQWYAGGSIGVSKSRYDEDGLASDLAGGGITGTGTAGGSAAGGRIFAGYQVYEVFALEAGYFNFGDYLDLNGTYTRPAPASTFAGSVKGQGVNLDLVWTVPLTKGFSALARVGGGVFRADPSWSANAAAFNTMSANARKNNTVGDAGLGLQYDFTKTIAGRLEWQRFVNVGTGLTGGYAPIDYFSAGMIVRF
jgi:hypothetical protein